MALSLGSFFYLLQRFGYTWPVRPAFLAFANIRPYQYSFFINNKRTRRVRRVRVDMHLIRYAVINRGLKTGIGQHGVLPFGHLLPGFYAHTFVWHHGKQLGI